MSGFSPYANLLKLEPRIDEDGVFRIVMPYHEAVMGRPGFLHGGAIAGLLELTAFETLKRALGDENVAMKPVTVTTDFMRGGAHRDTICEAYIERLGRRMANVEAFAWQKERQAPIAAAQINFLLERPHPHVSA
ncbi:PaaI family thioesterase [Sphingomicrobium nitratireducens]|uniref:PaaI family thioesterase n=1 Tax=Sphingomicrobium nitratireducens TaxID=2964666 RepID=UPI0022407554|nr:PaaI family thioesterase [Sphingomicrobium nitratireducens]